MKKTDILVVGAGPAGLAAAAEAARAGAGVILVDENKKAGGQLFKQIHKFFGSEAHCAGMRGFEIGEKLLEEALDPGAEIRLDTRALGLLDDGSVLVLCKDHSEQIMADRVILSAGAKEKALPFPGWTLPGVMTAGAAQTFANVHGTLVGDRILMIGSGNVGLIVSYQLLQAGASVEALIEVLPRITGYKVHAAKLLRAGVPVLTAHTIVEARGDGRVEEAVIARCDEHMRPVAGTESVIPCDTILIAVGLDPRAELLSMFRCETAYIPSLGGRVPLHSPTMRTSNETVYVCGDIAGVEEASTALDEGRLAGISAAADLGFGCEEADARTREVQLRLSSLRSGPFGERRMEGKTKITGMWEAAYGK